LPSKDSLRQFQQRVREGEVDVVLIGAIAGFVAGLMLWGTLLFGLINAVDGFSGSSDSPEVTEAGATAACDNDARVARTEGGVAVQPCATATPAQPTPTATVLPTPTIAPTSSNRFNCDKIKGTEYLSDEERTWYLANCVSG
jgi:hypothetical protein